MKKIISLVVIIGMLCLSGCVMFDKTPPIITYAAGDVVKVEVFDTLNINEYVTVTDDQTDESIVVFDGDIDMDTVGTYVVGITVEDKGGNITSGTITVEVVDETVPELTLLGESTIEIGYGEHYNEPGVASKDNYDNNLEPVYEGEVLDGELGTYDLAYSVVDTAGNVSSIGRIVNVVDNVAPTLSLVGESVVELTLGEVYDDEGATAVDEIDGDLVVEVQNDVNYLMAGDYMITYTAVDKANNIATSNRTITIAPQVVKAGSDMTITLTGVEINPSEYVHDTNDLTMHIIGQNTSQDTYSFPPMLFFYDGDSKLVDEMFRSSFAEIEGDNTITDTVEVLFEGGVETAELIDHIRFNVSKNDRYTTFPYRFDIDIAMIKAHMGQ